jgi:hypothetical protein
LYEGKFIMALTTFSGPVRSLGGFIGTGPGQTVTVANGTNTLTLDVLNYSGKVIYTNDATLIINLPTINPTPDATPSSSNNIGATFRIVISTAATAVAIKTDTVDKFTGSLAIAATDAAGAMTAYAPASSNDVINLNGTTTGGASGSYIDITAVANDRYMVTGVVFGSGSVATPFADA